MTENNKYWRGIEDQSNPELTQNLAQNEFSNEMSQADFLGNEELSESQTSRRDFLKFMGFSTAAATLAACEAPIVESIPYVVKPDSITPGVPNYYATSYFDGFDFASVLVKTREGRPIKIEPNKDAAVNGSTNARVQASVLSLYDGARLKTPMVDGAEASWSDAISKAQSILGEGSVVLSSTVISPSVKQAIEKLGLRHVQVDAVSKSARLDVYEQAYGKRGLPSINLEHATFILAIGADFIDHYNGQSLQGAYAQRRKPSANMVEHYQVEAGLSISGSNADVRIKARVSEYEGVLANVYNYVAKASGLATISAPELRDDIRANVMAAAEKLVKAGSGALVLNGLNTANAETLAAAINQALGALSFDTTRFVYTAQGSDSAWDALVADINNGSVKAVLTLDTNPAHTHAGAGVNWEKLKVVSIADRLDETASFASVALPLSHYLESWADFNAQDGHYSVAQPTISPLFDSKSAVEIINALAGGSESAQALVKSSAGQWANAKSWNALLHDGYASASVAETVETLAIDASQVKVSGALSGYEFYTYTKAGIGAGAHANNPWTYELPDPITRLSWDNYIVMSAADAVALGVKTYAQSNGAMNGNTVTLTIDGTPVENIPVWIQPGQTQGTLGLAVGFGRQKVGKVGNGVGVNAAELLSPTKPFAEVSASASEVEHHFASVQLAHTMMGRDIVKEVNLPAFLSEPSSKWNDKPTFASYKGPISAMEANLWDDHDHETSHMWNMSIDLNSCLGCGACVVACSLENNVPVVGKDEIRRHRDMHWLRIDRYYSSDMTEARAEEEGIGAIEKFAKMEVPSESPSVVFQPVMCQHCNHAPCETVCPVGATAHSREGLNHMAYNRCIGTRYCANNCPYKVRRFNWFNYKGNEKFADVNPSQDDFGRMVLNPDVTVRARGVIEKCSLCIQRIQLGKLEAKKEGRMLEDGEFTTACAQACDSGAIVFGDVNNPKSAVSHLKQEDRAYHLLEEVGTQPSIFYQTKVRNRA